MVRLIPFGVSSDWALYWKEKSFNSMIALSFSLPFPARAQIALPTPRFGPCLSPHDEWVRISFSSEVVRRVEKMAGSKRKAAATAGIPYPQVAPAAQLDVPSCRWFPDEEHRSSTFSDWWNWLSEKLGRKALICFHFITSRKIVVAGPFIEELPLEWWWRSIYPCPKPHKSKRTSFPSQIESNLNNSHTKKLPQRAH